MAKKRAKKPAAPRNTGLIDMIWAAIHGGSKPSCSELAKKFGVGQTTVHRAVQGWIAAGYVAMEETKAAGNPATVKRLCLVKAKDPGVIAPAVDSKGRPKPEGVQEKVWRAIQVMETFTTLDMKVIGLKGSPVIRYLQCLTEAGYLTVSMRQRINTYRRVNSMMTGPRAPIVMVAQGSAVWDRNLGRIVKAEVRHD